MYKMISYNTTFWPHNRDIENHQKQVSVLPSAGKGLKHYGVSPGILQRNDFHHSHLTQEF